MAVRSGRDTAERTLATVLRAVTECGTVPEDTGFSATLNRAAFTAGRLVGAGRMTPAHAKSALVTAAAQARPRQERRSPQIIRSAMSAGSRRPLDPGGRT
jgi:hypothetical protein